MLSAALELPVVAIVLVDGDGRIVHANRAGVHMLQKAQTVCCRSTNVFAEVAPRRGHPKCVGAIRTG
jgi:PAS domain-containing protein